MHVGSPQFLGSADEHKKTAEGVNEPTREVEGREHTLEPTAQNGCPHCGGVLSFTHTRFTRAYGRPVERPQSRS
jgi:hypothetical protein